MKDQEKQRIAVMRSSGGSYTEIAKVLNLSVNTVKTFCRRNHLGGIRVPINTSGTTHRINLIDAENRGNSSRAETADTVENTGVLATKATCRVKLIFAGNADENAITDVLGMLTRSTCRRRD